MTSPCPACQNPRATGQYLCRTCWHALPDTARRRLNRRGAGAINRYRSLLDQLAARTPLRNIRIQ